jgi:isopentenyl-diphosphate delta-isomerase
MGVFAMIRTGDHQRLTGTRKNQHVRIALRNNVEHTPRYGFQNMLLEHCALPELSLSEIDTSVEFLGKTMSMPLMISPITGGTPRTFTILNTLAEAAEEKGLALGVGSQRIALENPKRSGYFHIRDQAPHIPLFANLGAVQLNYGFTLEHCQRAVDMIEADALILHLNPLHECLQNEGNTDFRNLLVKIGAVVKALSVPVIVKEVGFGISVRVARLLADAGVAAIDIGGAGGTSWALIESARALSTEQKKLAKAFEAWGIPTAWQLKEFKKYRQTLAMPLIASGGVRSGIDIAKAIAMGASITGMGLPLLRAAVNGSGFLCQLIERIKMELTISMFNTGAGNIRDLSGVRLIES